MKKIPRIEYTVKVCRWNTRWFKKGTKILHRGNGPALEHYDGTSNSWYQNGKLHRLDGPAIEYKNGGPRWFINNKQLTEEEFNNRMSKCNKKTIKVHGRKYRLVEIKSKRC